ncbi:MAG: hypothetical protein MI757_05900, partial [Pirellulales bacterium]|nr:hypothetical protein [Pirellulales bacterium]
MIDHMPNDELFEVFAAMCDGTATPAQVAYLEQLFADEPQARSMYVEYMSIHAVLRWAKSEATDNASLEPLQSESDSQPSTAEPVAAASEPVMRRLLRHHLGVGIAVAFVFTLATLAVLHFSDVQSFIVQETSIEEVSTETASEIATLTAWHR